MNEMEELLAYAYMIGAGFHLEGAYKNKLDELFAAHSSDKDLMELEWMSGDMKESLYYIFSHFNNRDMDVEKFGSALMGLIKPVYDSMEVDQFADRIRPLGSYLQADLYTEEPFCYLHFADEPLAWGDVKQTKELYSKMLTYFDD
ncbi:MAG: hypothetical protein IJ048_02140 [Clostridia bacterium]|nr:hypothetical protein [Clostridia bacterium]